MSRSIAAFVLVGSITVAAPAAAAIVVNPNGVNVNSQGATTVFLTYGGLGSYVPAEAFWCGATISAAPAIGVKCDPATVFGSLPTRYNQSQLSGTGGYTDIMSIPASVARRAYQAAGAGDRSSFFYVRRFISVSGGPDEYVAVTCRMAGGGARVPLALTDVALRTVANATVVFVQPGKRVPRFEAAITYTGTGRLKGRWEVVLPGDEPPTPDDLLTEATLPLERRGSQRRYTPVERFNIFLPPTGKIVLPGPDPGALPTSADGTYLVLLRVEASDDKEGDSSLTIAGAGSGVVHSGAVAGFPMPPLRYVVGNAETVPTISEGLSLQRPHDSEAVDPAAAEFSWSAWPAAAVYRLEFRNRDEQQVHAALVPVGTLTYRAPSWLRDKAPDGLLSWRVVALDAAGRAIKASAWRAIKFGGSQ